ncbi:hypothetical protein, partial [Sphingomonas molluscorum]|uniref:hypothetical protein n=1 Tax=Sphingomonas molluscorum TaxID=418184 RepID=UPI0031DEF679
SSPQSPSLPPSSSGCDQRVLTLESGTILSFIAWRALCENWRAHAETIEGIVEDAAFRGETPFKQESRQLRLLPSVFHVF